MNGSNRVRKRVGLVRVPVKDLCHVSAQHNLRNGDYSSLFIFRLNSVSRHNLWAFSIQIAYDHDEELLYFEHLLPVMYHHFVCAYVRGAVSSVGLVVSRRPSSFH